MNKNRLFVSLVFFCFLTKHSDIPKAALAGDFKGVGGAECYVFMT